MQNDGRRTDQVLLAFDGSAPQVRRDPPASRKFGVEISHHPDQRRAGWPAEFFAQIRRSRRRRIEFCFIRPVVDERETVLADAHALVERAGEFAGRNDRRIRPACEPVDPPWRIRLKVEGPGDH